MEKFYGDMTTMTNREILDIYLNDGTLRTCVECQFSKLPNKEFMEDFFNDMVLLILEYDNHKLNNVHNNGHFNAWATRIIINNLFSTTSAYYRTYVRYGQRNEELDETYDNIADTDDEGY